MMHDNKSAVICNREIGNRIRQRRRELSMSQEQLAVVLDVSYQQIQRYECGKNGLNAEKLQEMARALSVPIMYLISSDQYDGSSLEDQGERSLIRCYRKVRDPRTKALLIRVGDLVALWEKDANG